MFSRLVRALPALILATGPMPSLAHAECVRISPKQLLSRPDTELVFSGRVVQVDRTGELGYRATFEVDRVWTGKVPKRLTVYVWELAAETPRFREGEFYVAALKRLEDKQAREAVGLADSQTVAFTGATCSDGFSVEEFVRGVGPGKPPIDEAVEGKIKRRPGRI